VSHGHARRGAGDLSDPLRALILVRAVALGVGFRIRAVVFIIDRGAFVRNLRQLGFDRLFLGRSRFGHVPTTSPSEEVANVRSPRDAIDAELGEADGTQSDNRENDRAHEQN
jgi:hypothetical protein